VRSAPFTYVPAARWVLRHQQPAGPPCEPERDRLTIQEDSQAGPSEAPARCHSSPGARTAPSIDGALCVPQTGQRKPWVVEPAPGRSTCATFWVLLRTLAHRCSGARDWPRPGWIASAHRLAKTGPNAAHGDRTDPAVALLEAEQLGIMQFAKIGINGRERVGHDGRHERMQVGEEGGIAAQRCQQVGQRSNRSAPMFSWVRTASSVSSVSTLRPTAASSTMGGLLSGMERTQGVHQAPIVCASGLMFGHAHGAPHGAHSYSYAYPDFAHC
jgi:hypothetical protein